MNLLTMQSLKTLFPVQKVSPPGLYAKMASDMASSTNPATAPVTDPAAKAVTTLEDPTQAEIQRKVQQMFRHWFHPGDQNELAQALVRCVLEYHLEREQRPHENHPLEPAA